MQIQFVETASNAFDIILEYNRKI